MIYTIDAKASVITSRRQPINLHLNIYLNSREHLITATRSWKKKREREREVWHTALTFIALVNSGEYQWTQPQLHHNRIESSSCFPSHTNPRFLPDARNLHPSISTRLHRYRRDRIEIRLALRPICETYISFICCSKFPPPSWTNLTRNLAFSLENRGWINGGMDRDG